MRKFYIEDGAGKRYDLNNQSGDRMFFSNPTGLGISMKPSFLDLNKGFYVDVSGQAENQGSIVGDLTFTGPNAYQDYQAFTNWLTTASKLFIVYVPFGETEYYREVHVSYLTKTELTAGRWLTTPLGLSCVTPWYKAAPGTVEIAPEAGNIVRFSFTYTEGLAYASSKAGTMSAEISADGHIPAAFELAIKGPLQNPTLELRSAAAAIVYGKCVINETISATDTLEVSTKYGDSYVRKVASDGTVTDLLDKVNLAFDPFPHAPLGETCYITLTADGPIETTGTIRVYYYYRSV